MPKGDNFKGPFKDLPSEGGVIAEFPCGVCSAGGPQICAPLKVTKQGWLIANCSAATHCGTRRGATTLQSAIALIEKCKNWKAGSKKLAYEIAGLKPAPPEIQPKPEPSAVVEKPTPTPTPDHTPEPEERSGVGFLGMRF